MPGPEAKVEAACREVVRSLGGLYIKLNPIGLRGIPDRLVLLPEGRAIFVEFKRPKKDLKLNQDLWKARLITLGFIAYGPVTSVEQFKDLIGYQDSE